MFRIQLKKALIIMIVLLLSYFRSQANCAFYSNDDSTALLEGTHYTGDYSLGDFVFVVNIV